MSRNEDVLEESDHHMEQQQGEFMEGTPSREVLLRINHNEDHIGDGNDVRSGTQDSLNAILSELKTLKSQMNLLQNQVRLTSDDTRQANQDRVRFCTNATFQGDQLHNAQQPYRSSSMPNSYDESREHEHSRTSWSNTTESRSFINNARTNEFQPIMRPCESSRERIYDYDVPNDGYLRQTSDHRIRRMQEPKGRKPASFDGTTNWKDYIVHFDMIAELNYWTDEVKALELATSLRGSALSVLSDLRPEYRYSFRHLVSALSARFEPENQTEIYKTQLKCRIRRKNESITELMQDIKRLVRMSYPNAPLDFRDQITKDSFIESLNEQDMEWSVFQGRPKSLEDAVRLALEYEAFQQARGRRNKATVRMQREEPAYTNEDVDNTHQVALISHNTEKKFNKKGPCFYCKKDGHIKSECRLLQGHIKSGKYRNQNKPDFDKNTHTTTNETENQENAQ